MSSISLKQLSARRMSYAISSIFRGAQKGSKVIQLDTQHRFIRGKSLLSYDRLVPKLWRVETLKLPFRCLQNIRMLKKNAQVFESDMDRIPEGDDLRCGVTDFSCEDFLLGTIFWEQEIEVHGHGGPRNLASLFSSSGGGFVNLTSRSVFFFQNYVITCAGGSAWFDAAGAMWEVYAVTRWTQWKRRVKELAL